MVAFIGYTSPSAGSIVLVDLQYRVLHYREGRSKIWNLEFFYSAHKKAHFNDHHHDHGVISENVDNYNELWIKSHCHM